MIGIYIRMTSLKRESNVSKTLVIRTLIIGRYPFFIPIENVKHEKQRFTAGSNRISGNRAKIGRTLFLTKKMMQTSVSVRVCVQKLSPTGGLVTNRPPPQIEGVDS